MGFRQLRISDVSGDVLDDKDVLTVIVKHHPAADGDSKVFDVSETELKALKTVDNLITLEVKKNGGDPYLLFCTQAEFDKLVPDEKLQGFDSARGRRTGFRPGN